ncbi:MAG: GDP-L-fucose synthase [Chthoniobacterales bacterium]|nr:GDP-L-fucose synthase [Chthoniobacterales bacterium]
MSVINRSSLIYVAGHTGMVGSAIVRALRAQGSNKLLLRTHQELDLCDAAAVRSFFKKEKPKVVIVTAARVGGIYPNSTYPAEFLHENLTIAHHLIHEAYQHGVKRLLFLGSSCIYPRETAQPIKEEQLLTGSLEPTNEAYAIAKIAGVKLCQFYRQQYGVLFHSIMPCNLYGPGDNYDLTTAHVLPALLRRFKEAKEKGVPSITLWGTGKSRREFLHVDDLADAVMLLLENPSPPDWINVGSAREITIEELARLIAKITGFEGQILWDASHPDGMPRKLLDSSKLRSLGWRPTIELETGIHSVYKEVVKKVAV